MTDGAGRLTGIVRTIDRYRPDMSRRWRLLADTPFVVLVLVAVAGPATLALGGETPGPLVGVLAVIAAVGLTRGLYDTDAARTPRAPLLALAVAVLAGGIVVGLAWALVRTGTWLGAVGGGDPVVVERVIDDPIAIVGGMAWLAATLWTWLVLPAYADTLRTRLEGPRPSAPTSQTPVVAVVVLLLVAGTVLAVTAGLHDVTRHERRVVEDANATVAVDGVTAAVDDIRTTRSVVAVADDRRRTFEARDGAVFVLVAVTVSNGGDRPITRAYAPSLTIVPAGTDTTSAGDERTVGPVGFEMDDAQELVVDQYEGILVDTTPRPVYRPTIGPFGGPAEHVDARERTLPSGATTTRWVVFEVPRGSRLRAVDVEIGYRTVERAWGTLRRVAVPTWKLAERRAIVSEP